MRMSQLTIMNCTIGTYSLMVSDGREYNNLSEVELIQKIEKLLIEDYSTFTKVEEKEEKGE